MTEPDTNGGPPPPDEGDAPPELSARRAANDPLGKRALFWMPPGQPDPEAAPRRSARRTPLGKHALYSTAPGTSDEAVGELTESPVYQDGPVTVTCERCGATSKIGFLDLAMFQLPFGYWLPRGRFDRRMTCPACRSRTWASVTLRRS